MRAYSPKEIINKKYQVLEWGDKWVQAFERPERSGVIFICGHSTNGKTSFVMQLMKELAQLNYGKVYMNSKEEGTRLTLSKNLVKHGFEALSRRIVIANEAVPDMDARLAKQRAPWAMILDSVQVARLTIPQANALMERHKDKQLIFISQADGNGPRGKTAEHIRYLADLKIWVEGFRAISQGRFNAGGYYTIWDEGADKYWGMDTAKSK